MTTNNRVPVILGTLAVCAVITACSNDFSYSSLQPELDRIDTLQSGGVARTFNVHLPSEFDTTSNPVVILFHRKGRSGVDMKYLTAFDSEASYFGFIAVYPDATTDWAYGCGCTEADTSGVDDVQFIVDLLDELDADYGINRDSVFVAGFAEGAFMAQKVVCDATDSFAGLASVGATMSVPVAGSCIPAREIPVLMILGTEDTEFPWDGALDLGFESVLAADTTVQFWATSNGCGDRLESVYVGTDYYYNFEVYQEGFDACPVNGDVILYRMDGEGATHGWPNAEFSASRQIADFFAGEGQTSISGN